MPNERADGMLLTRLLKFRMPMMVGEDVRELQRGLMRELPGAPFQAADGIFGSMTRRAVEQFQQRAGLSVDGVVGQHTWEKLFRISPPVAVPAAVSGGVSIIRRANDPAPPLGAAQTRKVAQWLNQNFRAEIDGAVQRAIGNGVKTTPALDFAAIAAIAAKETGFMFLNWIDNHPARKVLELCIGDASGDVPGTSRNAYPRNRAIFERDFPTLTPKLVAAANQMRAARTPPLRPAQLLYKGYGIFQYDLQHIAPGDPHRDERFFAEQQWGDMAACLQRVTSELEKKFLAEAREDPTPSLQEVLRRYNGGGERARVYGVHVMTMREHCLGI